MLKNFKEYLENKVVRIRTPDKLRAENLIKESKDREKFLSDINKNISITVSNAGFFIEYIYDVLISLVRAKMLIEGFEASGNNAHEAEVSYLKELNFIEEEINLMNEIRMFRNGVKYYGKKYSPEEANRAFIFMNNLLPKLKELIKT